MNKVGLILIVLLVISCGSVKKNNQRIDSELSIKEMQEDLDYLERKLFQMHPNLDWYQSEDLLHNKFDSLSQTITTPLKPNAFFLKVAPIIASVQQGHLSLGFLTKQLDKKNTKKYKNSKSPLAQIELIWLNEELYILNNNSKNKSIVNGSKVLEINDISPQEIYQKYRPTITSDGFNQTFIEKWFSKNIRSYYYLEIGTTDSLNFKLNCTDSISYQTVYRDYKKNTTNSNDSSQLLKKNIIPNKIQDNTIQENKKQKINGYNKVKKEYTIELSYPKKDSTFAVLKIRSFSGTQYKKAYKTIFEELNNNNVQNLVLDLRGNTGGRISEIGELYSYLTTEEDFIFLNKTEVTSKWKLPFYMFAGRSIFHYVLFSPLYILNYPITVLNTKKSKGGKYYYKLNEENKTTRKKIYYKNKLFVITDGLTFSASAIISSNLKGSERATFVGEETGGTYNGTVAGRIPKITLPNSKLKCKIGVMKISPTFQNNELGHGIKPDIYIKPSLDQIISKDDPEIEWIYNNIQN